MKIKNETLKTKNFFRYSFLYKHIHIINNCYFSKKNNIPQNKKNFFVIKKDIKWKWSISISFNLNEEIEYLNLFLILKSYLYNDTITLYSIGTSFYNLENNSIITQKENIKFLKRMSYDEFLDWIGYRIRNDWKYNKSKNFYSIKHGDLL